MVELKILSKYPFLNDAKTYVVNNKLSVKEILNDPLYERARAIGIERLDNAFKNRDVGSRTLVTDSDCIMELLSYPIARMIAVCIGDNYFKRRYALGEAINTYKNLLNESTDFLLNISKEFDITVKSDKEKNQIKIFFVDYLKHAPTRYKEWKMINRTLEKGYISITNKDLTRIIQEALRARINYELDIRDCDNNIYQVFKEDVNRIKNIVLTHKRKIEAEPIGKLDINKLPPCMKDILAAMQAGENVPHMGRFALVSFLNSLKLGLNDIIKLFSSAPDFEEEKSRYQIEHITGHISSTSYKSPGCDKMRTYGICPIKQMIYVKEKDIHIAIIKKNGMRRKKNK
jgi:DNA primase large subunit